MKEQLVSVIMPAYNCDRYLKKAVDSALMQEGVAVEVIVINDCSPDRADLVMKEYENEPRVIYIKNEKNLGAAKSRNKGVHIAKGKYTAFLDADDWWTPDKLKKQLAVMEREQVVLCSTARELMNEQGELTGRMVHVKQELTYELLLHSNIINCSSVVLLTEVAKKYPMEHDEIHEDYIVWLSILRDYKRGYGIDEPLLKYRVSNKGKSSTKLKSAYMTWAVYRHMGIGKIKSVLYLFRYMYNGIKKYTLGGKCECQQK